MILGGHIRIVPNRDGPATLSAFEYPPVARAAGITGSTVRRKGHDMAESMTDPFNLQRFVDAQNPTFPAVIEELTAGRKRGHWMWFVFPQLRGLGHSATAQRYGIGSLHEARAYANHSVLAPRLILCTTTVLAHHGTTLHALFGSPDDLKFFSSMTLFALAAGEADEASIFHQALQRFCDRRLDQATLRLLDGQIQQLG